MKNTSIIAISFLLIISLLLSVINKTYGQEKYHAQTIDIKVNGTSTLHDWEMTSNKGTIDASILLSKDKLSFSTLSFTIPAESLKSGHGMMDKNTYKAINTSKNPNIIFVLSNSTVTNMGDNKYQLKGIGKLTIAGKTLETDLIATLKYNPADKSFNCIGTKKFNMSAYGVKPPVVMMGAIKTGDAISISYNISIKN